LSAAFRFDTPARKSHAGGEKHNRRRVFCAAFSFPKDAPERFFIRRSEVEDNTRGRRVCAALIVFCIDCNYPNAAFARRFAYPPARRKKCARFRLPRLYLWQRRFTQAARPF